MWARDHQPCAGAICPCATDDHRLAGAHAAYSEALRARLMLDDHVPIEVMSSRNFFAPLATLERGMDAAAEQRARRFASLATLIETALSDVTVTQIGRGAVGDLHLGISSDGRVVELVTTVVDGA